MTRISSFVHRHIGPGQQEAADMAAVCGFISIDALIDATVPPAIRSERPLMLPPPLGEAEALAELRSIMGENRVMKSFIGQGYSGTVTPPVIQRNILENPGWYTAYTPYQAEIAQGRLEALLNYQTLITELTALPVANASLLDEGTAAAEAASLALTGYKGKAQVLFVDSECFPQTIEVLRTRMEVLGISVATGHWRSIQFLPEDGVFAAVVQYPDSSGAVHDYTKFTAQAHAQGAMVIAVTDLLALTLLPPPGAWGADIAVGSSQRFGVPMGWGGPHAAFMAVKDELKRRMPGRLVGVSIDSHGKPALRLSLQTREQHIRREKATSNICTAQVLLAVMASMYAVYHGPEGLRSIAGRVHALTSGLADSLTAGGFTVVNETYFDTLTVKVPGRADEVIRAAAERGINLRRIDEDHTGVSLDETATETDVADVLAAFGCAVSSPSSAAGLRTGLPARADRYLPQQVFHRYRTEHELLRYLHRLAARDLTLCDSMISLGSCTMKLNAAAEMLPMSWPEVNALHPFAPAEQTRGYARLVSELEAWLAEITGFAATSLQPNAGSQGEYAGLLAIRAWHHSRGETGRNICLIPVSAHGTNPASAVMVGMKVVPVKCDALGNIDVEDLRRQADANAAALAALMITYPSTHGVFEEGIREICALIHERGGQVYMDGANMNAQVGLTSPGRIGADVCHLNLHKTFCIPHGGGGPGVGPICVAEHLAPFLPGKGVGPVSAAPYGSASILTISWMYVRMMGGDGLLAATRAAILNANYVATRLDPHFPVLYRGRGRTVAHECIIDVRMFKESAGVSVEDVAKRLIDYGYHAPTMSWPVAGTLMIEPTESESRSELDRFCDAMIGIRAEIAAVESGAADRTDNVLHHAPHTAESLLTGEWTHAYSREAAAYPDIHSRRHKYWPPVGRVDNVHGDKHLVCTCGGVEDYA